MPDKDNFGAVLQPVGFCWQNNDLGLKQDSVTAALRSSAGSSGFHEMNHPVVVQQPVPFTKSKRAQSVTDDETWVDGKVNPTLSLFDSGDTRATTVAVAFHPTQDPISSTDGSTHCMGTGGSQGHASIAVACPTLTAHNDPSPSPQSSEVTQQVAAVHAASMTVRRLTAKECERLQAFPDDYTLIPWRKRPATECPDGPRYKALGNSMAVNCMAWIGERIAAVEANNGADAAPPLPNRADGRPRQRSSTNGGE